MKNKKSLLKVVKKRKWIIIPAVVILTAGIGASILLIGRSRGIKAMAGVMSAQSTEVTRGNITTTVVGTGNLESADAENVYLPEGVEVEEVLVESGDHVEEGDVLAKLDVSSVTNEMLSIQEEINDLDEEINEVKDDTESETVSARISGRIKKIYTREGTSVADTMAEHGALMLLSVDGKMSVELKNITSAARGDTVTVTLSDGSTTKEGTVASLEGTNATVTLTDKGTGLGETVTVTDEDGNSLGSGTLAINQPLEITGAAGTTDDIKVEEDEAVSAGDTLMTLTDVPASAEYQELINRREKLAKRLKKLVELSKTGTVTAGFTGTVQSVNISENSTVSSSGSASSAASSGSAAQGTVIGTGTASSSASGTGSAFINLSTSTGKERSVSMVNTSAKEKSTESGEKEEAKTVIQSISNLLTAPAAGNTAQTSIQTEQCSGTVEWTAGGAAFSGTFSGAAVYSARITLSAAQGYTFAADNTLAVTQDGASSIEWKVSGETVEITMAFPSTAITSCSLTMASPKAGEAPQTVIDSTAFYTGTVSWSPEAAVFQESSQYIATVTLKATGDYRFAPAGQITVTLNGTAVSQVSVSSDQTALTMILVYNISENGTAQAPGSENQGSTGQPEDTKNTEKQTNGQQQGTQKESDKTAPVNGSSGTGTGSGSGTIAGVSGGGGSGSSGGSGSAGVSGGSSTAESSTGSESDNSGEEENSEVTAFTISPQENMALSVSVDELDILSIALDQKAEISFDAIEDDTFEGTITSISDTASVNGGVAKYTVEITLPRGEDMRVGMNASATITVEDKQDILLIPVSALQERGNSVFVYTEQDSDSGALSGEIEVETGLSDGSSVEIISGLSEGDTVYYTRSAGTDSSTDSGMHGMFGGQMGGEMNFNGGERPSGENMPSGGSGGFPGRQ